MSSIVAISFCWTVTIRLIHLIVFSPDEVNSFRIYVGKFLWFLLPIVPCQTETSTSVYLVSAGVKILINHWIYHWLRICQPNDSYGRILMFFIYICSGTFFNDLQAVVIRLITRNKYGLLDFNNYPFLSTTIRDFWSRRYNLLISTLLRESVFNPVRRLPYSSKILAAMASFIMSGILHGHVAVAGFGAPSPFPAFIFFVLHGIACCVESIFPFTVPIPIKYLLTQGFLFITAPLYVGLFTRAGVEFFEYNKPLLIDAPWFPKLPVPNVCPK